jgi:hypothetical protein
MSKFYKYYAIKVQQTPHCRPFYLLNSAAEDILKWCDVPRKKEEFLAGYQRALDKRHELIADFLATEPEGGNNIIPSSIIIASREENTKISNVSGGPDDIVQIEINVEDIDFKSLVKKTINELKSRLSEDEISSISSPSISDDGAEIDIDDDENEEVPPQSYISQIVNILEQAGPELENLDENLRQVVKDYLIGISRPGLILDGQHRVFGAKNVSQFPVNLPIVLLPGLTFSEQVFHFYVLNNKAKPLNKTELRTIIATSLSNKEIDSLYDRFKQVGVTAEETEWTYKMNSESDSPFKGLIDFGLDGSKNSPISENVAFQVAIKFMRPNKKYRLIYKDVPDWDQGNDYSFRLKLFFALWRGVKNTYPNAWAKAASGSSKQILQKVSLINLQEYLFDVFAKDMPRRMKKNEPSPFVDAATLEEEVTLQLTYLHEDFFLKEWKIKGLDTSRGHKTFREDLEKAIHNQSQNLGNIRIFRAGS